MAILEHPEQLIAQLLLDKKSTLIDAQGSQTFAEIAHAARNLSEDWRKLSPRRLFLLADPTHNFAIQLLAGLLAGHLVIPIHPLLPPEKRQALLNKYSGNIPENMRLSSKAAPSGLGLLTSGSTGEPKIVVLEHPSYFANAQTVIQSFGLKQPGRVAIILPLYHSFALITQFISSLVTGGEIHFVPFFHLPGPLLDYLRQNQIQTLAGVPSIFKMMSLGSPSPIESITHLTIAGAAFLPNFIQEIKALFPQANLWVGYGLTEAGPRVSCISEQDPLFFQGSVGKAMPGIQLRLENQCLAIQSPSLMLTYLDDPEETQKRLNKGWLYTQDLADIDSSGYLYIRGRADDTFISGGEKISPLEVERVLNQHPQIRQAAVFGEEDPHLGFRIVALLELLESPLNAVGLRQYCQRFLEPALVPIRFYRVQHLPCTANGKLLRKALATCPREKI